MKRLAFLFILTTLLLGSCAPVTASPSKPVVDTVIPTVIPSQTPPPTPSAIPTITPYPPLHTQGPYLLFTRDHKSLTIMDADGSGRKQIQLPNDGYMKELERSVSPNDKRIAYFTGSKSKPYDLALNLFNLEDETTSVIANIIAPGFPENLEPVTETANFTEYDTDCSNDLICRLSLVDAEFENGIESLSWSPDSQSLAFAAQIDGPSSDLYIYDVTDKLIHRVTNELENISTINWSPNGKKILYTTSQPGTFFIISNIRIANPQSKSLQNPKTIDGGPFWGENGWVTDDKFVYSIFGDGGPQGYDVQYLDVTTIRKSTIWRYSTHSVLLDSKNKTIILSTIPYGLDEWQPEPVEGTYFVDLNGKYTKISNDVYQLYEKEDLFDSYFGININDNQLVNIKFDGTIKNLSRKGSIPPRISPDGKWILMIDDKGTELYSGNLELIKSWDTSADTIIWRPDSKGVFLYSLLEDQLGKLNYLSIPDGVPVEIDILSPYQCCSIEYVWLP